MYALIRQTNKYTRNDSALSMELVPLYHGEEFRMIKLNGHKFLKVSDTASEFLVIFIYEHIAHLYCIKGFIFFFYFAVKYRVQ